MPGVAGIGGCCCDAAGCRVKVRATDCGTATPTCPGSYPALTPTYAIYYPAGAATPACSGTLTRVGTTFPAVWESPDCVLPGAVGTVSVRARVDPGNPRYVA